jgi:flagellin-specific chaperone FliS
MDYILTMPRGLFVVNISPTGDGSLIAKYIAPPNGDIPIGPNEILNIQMGLSSSEKYSVVSYPDYLFLVYNHEYRVKRDTYHLICGVILEKDDDTLFFQDALSIFATEMINQMGAPRNEIEDYCSVLFEKHFKNPAVMFDLDKVKGRLKSQLKVLTEKGKYEEAKVLSDQLKKIPDKIFDNTKKAERSMMKQDYDKAKKYFEEAKDLAAEIKETELIKLFTDKIKLMEKIPELLENRQKVLDEAINSLKNGEWERAARAFSKSSDLSKELSDSLGAEEYDLKAKTLFEYAKIDKKFKALRGK